MSRLRTLAWIYVVLLIFEGSLRKWIVPALDTPLLIIRDPLVIWIYYQAWQSRLSFRSAFFVPNLVLAGHVHDYQRIEKTIAPSVPTPFIVAGNGGYHNLHALHSKAGDVAPDTGAVLRYGNDTTWGFLTLVIDGKTISGSSTQVDRNGKVSRGDSFSYPVEPVTIAKKSVPTL